MGKIMDEMLAVVESRCKLDPDGEAAFRFVSEWIDVSLEMGLDPDYRRQVELTMTETQEVLF